jgi:hypothetical protein
MVNGYFWGLVTPKACVAGTQGSEGTWQQSHERRFVTKKILEQKDKTNKAI